MSIAYQGIVIISESEENVASGAQEPEPEPEEAAGTVATDEASLAAALKTFGKARVEPGTVIRLSTTLLIREFAPDYNETKESWEDTKEQMMAKYHCECRRLRPRRERQSVRGACAAGGRREG